MKQFTHLRDGRKVAEYLIDVGAAIIGRGRSAQIRLDDNKIVSRQHCVVRQRQGVDQHVVEDLGGANGTFVNGYRIEVHILRPGDRIVLGEDTLRYDFASRTAVTLRDEPPPRDILPGATDPTLATDSMEFEEISMDAVDVVNDLAEVREVKKQRIESGMHDDSGERTTVAGKDELERLLAEMSVKKGPHFVVRDGDETSLVPLPSEGPVHIGHSDDCVVRLPGWKLFGRLAASMVHQAGGCRRSSRATSAWSSARRCRDRTPTSRCTAVPRSSPARRSRRATPPTSSSHTTAETLPGDPGPVAAGSPHTVTLDRGDVLGVASTFPYLLPSDPDYCADQGWEVGSSGGGAVCTAHEIDLTGTVVTSSAPVAVWAGHPCRFVPADAYACDHLEEQMLPTSTWGDEILLVAPMHPDGTGPVDACVRVLALLGGTTVTFDPPVWRR